MHLSEHSKPHYGGSAEAVQYHYDIGRQFYRTFLDASMTYSCALWELEDGAADLQRAQERKMDFHLHGLGASSGASLLDIGCGWGGLLRRAGRLPHMRNAVGLTLSQDQADYVANLHLPNTEVRLESWVDHVPARRYDAIVSVGAFEHFASAEDTVQQKIAVYRDFFTRCSSWLAPNGVLSLQTIAYGNMQREDASEFINNEIFPAADLPCLEDIASAARGVLEIMEVHNHRLHYARTLECWRSSLHVRRAEAAQLVGAETTARYLRYLALTAAGFHMGKLELLRLRLKPVGRGRGRDKAF